MINESQKRALPYDKFFWLVLISPIVLVALAAYLAAYLVAPQLAALTDDQAVGWLLLVLLGLLALLMVLMLVVPGLALLLLNQRNQIAIRHHQLQAKQSAFSNHYLHVEHFSRYLKADLVKRLGVSPRGLHELFFPHSREGDFSENDRLLRFIHHGFAEVDQAAQIVEKLYPSLDEDEQAVAQNRLEFVLNRSVGLMYFIAAKTEGQKPECDDYFFLNDAMADHYDLIGAISSFDGLSGHQYNLQAFSGLFQNREIKAWFGRNGHVLKRICEQCELEEPLLVEFQQWH